MPPIRLAPPSIKGREITEELQRAQEASDAKIQAIAEMVIEVGKAMDVQRRAELLAAAMPLTVTKLRDSVELLAAWFGCEVEVVPYLLEQVRSKDYPKYNFQSECFASAGQKTGTYAQRLDRLIEQRYTCQDICGVQVQAEFLPPPEKK